MIIDAIIPVLLLIAGMFAGFMSYIAHKKVYDTPSYSSRRAPRRMDAEPFFSRYRQESGFYRSFDHSPGMSRERFDDPLGRGKEKFRKRTSTSATGRGYGSGGRAYYDEYGRFHSDFATAERPFEKQQYQPQPPSSPAEPHWSEILGISRTSNHQEIRAAYAAIMRKLHPDVAPQTAETSQRCTEVRIAYEKARQEAKKAS